MEKNKEKEPKGTGALGGILGGLTEVVEKLAELARKGEELSKVGSLQFKDIGGKELKGIYGVSFKVGIGGEGARVEPFGNVRKDTATGHSVVHEIHEPIVDVFDEEDHILIIAEMPGVEAKDVQIDLQDDILTFTAETERRKYRKEVLLPREFDREGLSVSSKNGIVRIRFTK